MKKTYKAMQYINELSEQEILKLTQDELDRMVKFKMAQERAQHLENYFTKLAETEYVRTEIYGRFNEVKEKYANFELSLANFLTYLEIANGDFKQAMAFFTKAYEPDSETIQYVENHYKKETKAPKEI